MMAGFDPHSVCARCRDKKKGTDPCVEKPEADCALCNALTPEQLTQLSTPSYKLKKEKKEAKSSTPSEEQAADTQSHPRGPGTCVGSGGRGWPDHLWFEWTS